MSDDPIQSVTIETTVAEATSAATPDVGFEVEGEDINVGPILRLIMFVAVGLGIIIVGIFQLVNLEVQDAERVASTIAGSPALQQVEANAAGKLGTFEVLGEGQYRVPIDHAIDLMVNEAYLQGAARTYTSELPPPYPPVASPSQTSRSQ